MNASRCNILLIEQCPQHARRLRALLANGEPHQSSLVWADCLSAGLNRLAEGTIDVVLLDLCLPDSQGLATFFKVYQQVRTASVIVLARAEEESLALDAVRNGAQDYLRMDEIDHSSLHRALCRALERKHAGEQFHLVFESAPNAMVMVDEQGRIRLANSAAETLFGYERVELIGQPVEMLVPERHRDRHPDSRRGFFQDPKARRMGTGQVLYGQRKDGSEFPVEIALNPLETKDGRLVLSAIVDITERKQAEQAIHESEARYRSIVESTTEAVVIADCAGNIVGWNRSAQVVFGYTPDEVMGKPLTLLMPERYHAGHREGLERFCSTGNGRVIGKTVELHGLTKQRQELPVEISLASWQTRAGRFYSGIIRDLSESKRSQQRVLQSERLGAIGEAMTSLAHESRNALQRSQGALEMLARLVHRSPEAIELIADVQQAQQDLQRLYEEVCAYAAPFRLDCEVCHLGQIVWEAWEQLSLSREKRTVQFRQDSGNLDLHCEVDPLAVRHVFRILLENALEACRDPVEIEIRYSNRTVVGEPAVCVAVQDNGPGVTSQPHDAVFRAFHTTKRHGTGLGLAIAKRFVEAHGGEIAVNGEPGGGAAFLVTFPRRSMRDRRT